MVCWSGHRQLPLFLHKSRKTRGGESPLPSEPSKNIDWNSSGCWQFPWTNMHFSGRCVRLIWFKLFPANGKIKSWKSMSVSSWTENQCPAGFVSKRSPVNCSKSVEQDGTKNVAYQTAEPFWKDMNWMQQRRSTNNNDTHAYVYRAENAQGLYIRTSVHAYRKIVCAQIYPRRSNSEGASPFPLRGHACSWTHPAWSNCKTF